MSVIYIDEKKNPLKSPIYRRFLEWIREEKYKKNSNEEKEIYYSKEKDYTYTVSCKEISNRGEYFVMTRFKKKISVEKYELCLSILSNLLNNENDYYIGEINDNYIDGKINSMSEIEIVCAGTIDNDGIIDAGLALINQILLLSFPFQSC